jgi:hypothetical protein
MAAAAFLTITATTERAASTPAGLVPLTRNETRLFTALTGHQPTHGSSCFLGSQHAIVLGT